MWKQVNVDSVEKIMVVRKDGTWMKLSELLEGDILLKDYDEEETDKKVEPSRRGRSKKETAANNPEETKEADKSIEAAKGDESGQTAITETKNIWKDGKVQFSYEEMLEQLTRDCEDPDVIVKMKGVTKSDKAVILKKKFGWATDHIAQELKIKCENVRVYLSVAKKAGKL